LVSAAAVALDRSGSHRPTAALAPTPSHQLLTVAGERYLLDSTGPAITVTGRWDCSSSALPAVLEVQTGQVWVFPSWPGPGASKTGRDVATVAHASGLARRSDPTTGCDTLIVDRTSGRPVSLDPGRTW
jgi:hypothetical protein